MNFLTHYFLVYILIIAVNVICEINAITQKSEIVEVTHEFRVQNGEAVITVPIQAPKGVNGLRPDIKLQYGSNNFMNKELGVGWSLSGISEIYRCQKNFALDNTFDAINYNYSDVFCLDGRRLVLIKGQYGYPQSEYRTEIDEYKKIVALDQQGYGPKYFKVYTKENLIFTYGEARNSSIGPMNSISYTEITTPARWLVSKIEDYSGNLIEFNYIKEPQYSYLNKIVYSNRVIQFNYDIRDDIQTKYVKSLLEFNITKILKSISLNVASKEIKRYEMEYNQYSVTKLSQLKSITICANGTLCSNPLKFNYEATVENASFDLTQTIGDICNSSDLCELKQVEDMNGDGLQDIVAFGNDGVYVTLNLGGRLFGKAQKWTIDFTKLTGWNSTKHLRLIADMNKDNLPDIVGFGENGIYVSLNANGYFKPMEKWLDGWSFQQGYKIETNARWLDDANNDGFLDFIVIGNDGIWIAFNNYGTGFLQPKYTDNYFKAGTGWGITGKFALIDINGDDIKERVGYDFSKVYAFPLFVFYNVSMADILNYNKIYYKPDYVNDPSSLLFIDVNNDNLKDMVGFLNNSAFLRKVTVFDANRLGYTSSVILDTMKVTQLSERIKNYANYAVDLNCDGFVELIEFNCKGVFVNKNSRNTFESPVKWSSNILTCDSEPRYVVDMNGDLVPDIVAFYGQFVKIGYNPNKKPKIINLIDSFGNVKMITYSTLAIENNKNATPKFLKTFNIPQNSNYTSFGNNVDVVSKVSASDGSGGQNVIKYSYGPNRCGIIQGRSECTFTWVYTENIDSQMSFIDEYYHEYPLTRVLRNQKGYYKDTLVYEKNFEYITRSQAGKINRNVILASKKNDVYGLDGIYIKSEFSVYVYDDFGSIVNSVENITDSKGFNFSKITTFKYRNNENTWFIGEKISKSIVNLQQTNKTYLKSITRDEYYEYSQTNRLLIKKTTQPNDPEIGYAETFEYDKFGNVKTNVQRSLSNTKSVSDTRTRNMYYDANGLNIISFDNALLHRDSYRYDLVDNVVNYADINGLFTNYTFDSFGHKLSETNSQGVTTVWLYEWDSPQTLPNSVYKITSKIDGTIRETKFYDSLNREIRKITLGFNGEEICEDSIYNSIGSLFKKSKPYKLNKDVPKYITFEYDALLRETKRIEEFENGNTIKTEYVGLKVIKSDKSGRFTINTKNIVDQVVKVEDSMGSVAQYEYDLLGNLAKYIDPQGSVMTMTYNLNGQKLSKNDPAMGVTTYKYNAFNELVYSRNAKGDEIILERDVIGRIIKRTEREGVTTWTFDTTKYGQLGTVKGPNDYIAQYKYDAYARVTEQLLTYNSDGQYSIKTEYDKLNRIISQTYPSNVVVYQCYNKYGYLSAVSMNDSTCQSGVLWKSNGYDAIGNIESEIYGNRITNQYTYAENSQVSKIISTGMLSPTNYLRKLEYEYDARQNLAKRSDFDYIKGKVYQQKYSYDTLNRLTSALNYVSTDLINNNLKLTESCGWIYDSIGNILSYHDKNEYLYEYDPMKLQQAIKIGNETVQYDALGNVIKTDSYEIDWYTFSKARTIRTKTSSNTTISIFTYGPNREMITKDVITNIEASNIVTSVHYIGDTYERIILKNVTHVQIVEKYHIKIYGKIIGTHIKVQSTNQPQVSTTLYYHNDAFGSVDSVSDSSGSIVLKYSYSAFGRVKVIHSNLSSNLLQFINTGYVGHTHLDGTRLINMNGRIFDAVFARFLSPDPFIQDIYNIQNLNRYSYALNNPFKYKDPSGHFWKSIKNFFTNPRVIVAVVVAVATAGVASAVIAPALLGALGVASTSFAGSVISGAVVGASSSFTSSLVMTNGNVNEALKSAAIGAITGGISGGIDNLVTNQFGRFAANTVADGISNRIQKRDFFDGFELSALSFVASKYYESAVGYEKTTESGGAAVPKGHNTPPVKGANNIGIQDSISFWREGGLPSRALNKIGGINAVAGMHDAWQVKLPDLPREILNVPLMPLAGAVTYLALYNDIRCPLC